MWGLPSLLHARHLVVTDGVEFVIVVSGTLFLHTASLGSGDVVGGTALGTVAEGGILAFLSVVAALISIVTKEILFWYTKGKAEQINSVSLKAAAWDHRADVIGTLGALAGIIASRCGFAAGDLIASLIVCLFIIRTAYLVFREAISQMTDRSCDETVLNELRDVILSEDGVLGIDMLQVRTFGNRLYVDLEIREDGNVTLHEAHEVAERVHDTIEQRFPVVKHIMIHVNPSASESIPAENGK